VSSFTSTNHGRAGAPLSESGRQRPEVTCLLHSSKLQFPSPHPSGDLSTALIIHPRQPSASICTMLLAQAAFRPQHVSDSAPGGRAGVQPARCVSYLQLSAPLAEIEPDFEICTPDWSAHSPHSLSLRHDDHQLKA
jgi:hypothetical protein